jgi:hypothetical protein
VGRRKLKKKLKKYPYKPLLSSNLIFLFFNISRTEGSCHSWTISFRSENKSSCASSFDVFLFLSEDDVDQVDWEIEGGGAEAESTLALERTPRHLGPKRMESSSLRVEGLLMKFELI